MDEKLPHEYGLDDLNSLYTKADEVDKRIFAEMRTNLQLVAGDHYVREGSKFWNRIREDKNLSADQRLRLTKNHIQVVTDTYRNEIESIAPGVAMVPMNESELADQKAAQLHESVWRHIKYTEKLPKLVSTWTQNFVELGEVVAKIYWVPKGGKLIGYEPMMQPQIDPMTGQPMLDPEGNGVMGVPAVDENGQPVPDESKPIIAGRCRIQTFEAYNLKRAPEARSLDESPYLILAHLMPKKTLRLHIQDPKEMEKYDASPLEEFTIFDPNTGTYTSSNDQVLVKEIYWRPVPGSLPNGYFCIYTGVMKVASGELPGGVFPIVYELFREQTGCARGHSIIRPIRPPQIEINRMASTMAEHQVTVGHDKVWVNANAKVTQGAFLPGVRVNYFTGQQPVITEGRSGAHYLEPLLQTVEELYKLANLRELVEEQPESADLYTNLLRSARFRKKFALYAERFERFLVNVAQTALAVTKHHIEDYELIPAVGQNEWVNIAEFKKAGDICYQIKVEPRSEDVESQFGKQVTLNHILQYVGTNLEKEDIGLVLRSSPFLNKELSFKKLTQRFDGLTNDILAMDRGIYRPANKYDDHDYLLAGLSARMKEADFERLPDQVKMAYQQRMEEQSALKAEQLADVQRAQAGFIPSGGFLVSCDFYVKNPKDPLSTKRLRVPSESISWLMTALEKQGLALETLEQNSTGVLQDVGNKLTAGGNDVGQGPSAGPGVGTGEYQPTIR